MNPTIRHSAALFALAVVAAGAFALLSSPISGPDMVQYDTLGLNLAHSRGFSLSVVAPYVPTMYREPLYPLCLSVIYRLSGHRVGAAIFIQMLFHAATAVLAYLIACRIFPGKAALLAGVLVAVFPTLANMASYLLSETFFTFELCLCILLLSLALERQSVASFCVCGIAFGCLTLTRTIVIFLPVVILSIVFLCRVFRRAGMKRFAIGCVCFAVMYAGVVSVWPIRNKMVFDAFSMAGRGGMVLWSRAEKIDDSPREIIATVVCSFSEYLGNKLFPDIVVKSNRYFFKDLEREMAMEVEYARQGMPPGEIDKKMAGEAFRKIAAHPFRYAGYTAVEGLKMTAFSYIPLLNEGRLEARFSVMPRGGLLLALAKGASRLIAYILLALVLTGAVRHARLWGRWGVLAVVILYVNVMYSLLDAIGRYAVPLIPLYCIIAAAAFFPVSGGEDAEKGHVDGYCGSR